jgi:hypothetical protein
LSRLSCANATSEPLLCNDRGVPASHGPPRDKLSSELLDAIAKALAGMPDSPQKRQLSTKADTYRRTLDQFRTSRVTQGQRDALDEMVLALHGKLLDVLRRASLDLTPGPIRAFLDDEDDDEPPPSSTPLARVQLRGNKEKR